MNDRTPHSLVTGRRGPALLLLLVTWLMALVAVPPPAAVAVAQSQDDARSGRAVDESVVPEALRQWISESRISAQEALGKLLWEQSADELAAAYLAAELSRVDVLDIVRNAGVAEPHRLAKIYGDGDGAALAATFRDPELLGSTATYHRLLNALRYWLFDGRSDIGALHVAAAAIAVHGADVEWVAETLAADFPYNAMPEALPETVTGRLVEADGVRILYLWGTPLERGYAYGKLLGPEIFNLWRRFVVPVAAFTGGYARIEQMQDLVFEFPEHYLDEIKGMYAGLRASVPEQERRNTPLRRDLRLSDLKVGQTLSDWRQFGCSSISVWGDRTADGRVLTARNLDYMPSARVMADSHVIVVNAPFPASDTGDAPGRQGWVSMGFAGTLGAYTAMNDDGVTAMIHDTHGHYGSTIGVLTRPHIIRHALETADSTAMPRSFAEQMREVGGLVPGNVHISWPREFGNDDAGYAASIEFDGFSPLHGGVSVRTIAHNSEELPGSMFVVTNHHCLRYHDRDEQTLDGRPLPEARPVPRDSERRLRSLEQAGAAAEPGSVCVDVLREWLQSVAHTGTFHSVVFEPDTRTMHAMFARPQGQSAPHISPVPFQVRELVARVDEFAAAGAVVGGPDEADEE